MKRKAFKIYKSEPHLDYNPALPEEHGTEQLSDEESGNIGIQELLEEGTDDADRTRPVDIDVHELHNPEPYADTDERRRNPRKGNAN